LIDEARRCSDSSAEKFAKVAGETADTIAAAAFDKCLELWSTATNKLNKTNRPEFTEEDYRQNPQLLNEEPREISEEPTIEQWREMEIRRLRVFVLELRSKAPSP
jgi:hypothetical protein